MVNKLPCRRCGNKKPMDEVVTRFATFNHPGVLHLRMRMCDLCRTESARATVRKYRQRKKETAA